MRIAVVGLGYVGAVGSACLADLGHRVIGVDIDPGKVGAIQEGRAPIHEPGLDEVTRNVVSAGRLTATREIGEAVAETDLAILCVGTPSTEMGAVDQRALERAASSIGSAIARTNKRGYLVLNRSTCLPPVHLRLMDLLAHHAHLELGPDLGYGCHPEFLRESVAIHDFAYPPKIVYGLAHDAFRSLAEQLYPGIDAPTFFVDVRTAAMVKYADNCFHAVKVTFGNEIGLLCRAMNVDPNAVMDLFCSDRKLNISDKYLRPGLPYGGSCLPKDLRAVLNYARSAGVALELLSGAERSNTLQLEQVGRRIQMLGARRVGMVGVSFKQGTPDMRESPLEKIAHHLLSQGHEVRIYDELLSHSKEDTASTALGSLRPLMVPSLESLLDASDALVVGHPLSEPDWARVSVPLDLPIIDLTNAPGIPRGPRYEGLYWAGGQTDEEVFPRLEILGA